MMDVDNRSVVLCVDADTTKIGWNDTTRFPHDGETEQDAEQIQR